MIAAVCEDGCYLFDYEITYLDKEFWLFIFFLNYIYYFYVFFFSFSNFFNI